MIRKLLFLSALLISTSSFSQDPYIETEPFVAGLTSPLAMAHCGDERVFIVQKNGIIRIADAMTGTLVTTPFLNIDPQVGSSGGEQGLLGMAFHPDYKNNGYFFLNYTNNSGHTVISRFSVNPADSNLALPLSEVILHTINQPYTNHNGGNLAFGPDGYLYIGMGDGGSGGDPQNRAQNKKELLGKMLRIDVSYSDSSLVPPTNPFVNDTAYRPQIWQTGLRNPWRYSFDRITGDLWIGDVGQVAWEEIDFQPASSLGGENWGWRCYEGNTAYNTAGCQPQSSYDAPVYVYGHTGGNCSVDGGYVYRGARYGNFNGHYIFSDYCSPLLRTLKPDTAGNNGYLVHSNVSGAGLVGFGEDVYGELYTFDMSGGEVLRLRDTTYCAPNALISANDTVFLCDTSGLISTPFYPGLIYQWYQNGIAIGGNEPELQVNQSDVYSVTVFNPSTGCSNADTVTVISGNAAPQVSWLTVDSVYCTLGGTDTFLLAASPPGGTYYGMGVNDSMFVISNLNTGMYLQEYVIMDSAGCRYSDMRLVRVETCAGTEDREVKFGLYPNPARTELTLAFRKALSGVADYTIRDASGRIIRSGQIAPGITRFEVSLTGMDAGSYYLQVSGEYAGMKPFILLR